MNSALSHNLIQQRDPDGRIVVGVLLPKSGQRAWIFQSDYDRIVATHGHAGWYLNSNNHGVSYVRLDHPQTRRTTTVARLVAGDFPRSAIRYRDGNRQNLRSNNLEMAHGAGGCPKRRRKLHA